MKRIRRRNPTLLRVIGVSEERLSFSKKRGRGFQWIVLLYPAVSLISKDLDASVKIS